MKAPINLVNKIAKAKELNKTFSGTLADKRFKDIVSANTNRSFKHEDQNLNYFKAACKIADSKSTLLQRLEDASNLVKQMERDPNAFPSRAITSILDKLFAMDHGYRFADYYDSFLKRKGLDLTYFRMHRFLVSNQYEQAIELFWARYDYYKQAAWVNIYRLMKNLRAYDLLRAASIRNDTEQIMKLLEVLEKHDLISSKNYAACLNVALFNNNYKVTKHIYNIWEQVKLTQSYLQRVVEIAISNQDLEFALDALSKIESPTLSLFYMMRISLFISSTNCWEIMDKTFGGIEWRIIEEIGLPSELQKLSHMDDFEILDGYMNTLSKLESRTTRKLLIRSLLLSIDNGQGHFGSALFILNYLNRNDMIPLLDSKDIDILSNLASHYGSKIATVLMADLLAKHNIVISQNNYYDLMRAECHGTEHEGLYLFAVRCLRDHGSLSEQSVNLIKDVASLTDDTKAARFLEERDNLLKASMIVDYTYLSKHFESFEERIKAKHVILNGFGKYDKYQDHTNVLLLISSEKYVNIMTK